MTASPTTSPILSDRERRVLRAVCEAFHPKLEAEPGDDPGLFAASAVELGVPEAAEQAIGLMAAAEGAQLRRLLRLLDGPLLNTLLTGIPVGVMAAPVARRERLLLAMSASGVPALRSGFQALKRLSSFLFYSVRAEGLTNPTWDAIGYRPSPMPPVGPDPLRLTTITSDHAIDCDACVVGSGAGGGVVAARLAASGLDVVVLEAGPPDQAADFSQLELEGTQRLYLDHGLTTTRDLGVSILAGSCVGGGTAVNWQTSLRTPDFIRDEWSERSGVGLFTSDRFSLALDSVSARIGVSTDESVVNANNAPLERGCAALGYEWKPIARNARRCDVSQCGYCSYGCRIGGKQSTTVTYLRDAQRDGDARVIASCRAERVIIVNGRVTGVAATVAGADGRRHTLNVRAPLVFACAGGIESPALLQRSGISLAHLGRHLYLHPTTGVAGIYDERVESWSGPPQTIVSSQFARAEGNFGFRLEAVPAHPGILASAVAWRGPREHRRLMQRAGHASGTIILTRDDTGGRVSARRDGGRTIDYRPAARERALLTRGIGEAVRIHLAAGAREAVTMFTSGLALARPAAGNSRDVDAFCARIMSERVHGNRSSLFSAHQMGTCRIGRDAASAVCDANGEVFGVHGLFVADASAFPASSGVNPMLTVMGLAASVADAALERRQPG